MRVRIQNLKKKYFSLRGAIKAIDGIDLIIENGEFFVLLGPSGCGKSTLLNLIAGLEKPSSGEIWFDDKIVSSTHKLHLMPQQRNVAMVFQNYALYPHLTVFENIAFPLRIMKLKKEEVINRVKEVAQLLKISDLLTAHPAELSGGQRQRVAVARAIVRKPKLFLLDEPLSNLDAQLRIVMRGELKELQRRLRITTIYVTHDQSEALALGDRIAVMRNGRIEQVATPKQLYQEPQTIFVASFIGTPAMNLLELKLQGERENYFATLAGQRIYLPREKVKDKNLAIGETFILGIRPENIEVDLSAKTAIKATITRIENLGKELLCYLKVAEHRLHVLILPAKLQEGKELSIRFKTDKIHLFKKLNS